MSFSFNFGKFKKHDPREFADFIDEEFDYEYADEYFFDDDVSDDDVYDI